LKYAENFLISNIKKETHLLFNNYVVLSHENNLTTFTTMATFALSITKIALAFTTIFSEKEKTSVSKIELPVTQQPKDFLSETQQKKLLIRSTVKPEPPEPEKKISSATFGQTPNRLNYYNTRDTTAFKKKLEEKRDALYAYICHMELQSLSYQAKKPVPSEIMHNKHMTHVKISHAIDRCNNQAFGVDSETKKRIPLKLLIELPEATSVGEIKKHLTESTYAKNERKHLVMKNVELDFVILNPREQNAIRDCIMLSMHPDMNS